MVSELDGTASVSVLYIVKDAAAVAALTEFFEGHMEFMKAKRETKARENCCTIPFLAAPSGRERELLKSLMAIGHCQLAEQFSTSLKFMKLKRALIIIGRKLVIFFRFWRDC